ncbi:MAG: condensation domain-containing protein, partial [Bacteroidota bacterium]
LKTTEETNAVASTKDHLDVLTNKMIGIWQAVLQDRLKNYLDTTHNKIQPQDNFFYIGGDSILAVNLSSKIYKEMNLKVEVADIFEYPILADLIAHLTKSITPKAIDIPKASWRPYYDASPGQSRFYLLQQLSDDSTRYNLSGTLLLEGKFDLSLFKKSLHALMERYESLRTSFKQVNGEVKQFICGLKEVKIPMAYIDLREEQYTLQEAIQMVQSKALPVFDLSHPSLFQLDFYQVNEGQYLLLVHMHHIICDEWSLNVFMRELKKHYQQIKKGTAKLPMPKVQYKDYATWYKKEMQNHGAQLSHYWKEQFKGGVPKLDLPLDHERPPYRSSTGGQFKQRLTANQLVSIEKILARADVTPYMFFTAVVTFFLHQITKQQSIIFGTPFSGRVHPDLEDQIGLFINTIVLQQKISEQDTFSDCLQKAKKQIIEAQAHQLFPFNQLVAEVDYERETGRNPFFDVWMVYQNPEIMDQEFYELDEEIKMKPVDDEVILNRYDLKFAFIKTADQVEVIFEYSKDVFRASTGQNLFEALFQCLNDFIEHFDEKINHYSLDVEQLKRKPTKPGLKKVARN